MTVKRQVKILLLLFVIIICMGSLQNIYAVNTDEKNVYIVPIKGEINPATTQFVKYAVKKAEDDPDSVAIIFEIDTLGGMINEATEIRDIIMKTPLYTISYVNNKAESAGVLITIASEKIVMSSGGTIGSAETIPFTEKNISYWKGELRATAEQRGRDPRLVEAMADRRIEIPNPEKAGEYIVQKGELLNLTTKEAEKLGFLDITANSYEEILDSLGIDYTNIIDVPQNFKMMVAKLVSSSVALPIILSIGFIGLVIELLTPGFGLGGTVSLIAFVLFFGGSMLAGNAGAPIIALFAAGLVLLLIEAMIPGFGAPGIGGIVCIIVSIILASDSIVLGITSLMIAFVIASIAAALLLKYAPRNKYFDRIILKTELKKEAGFVPTLEKDIIVGAEGIALTPLRPAGTVEIGERKLDVVTEGEFILKDSRVKVVNVEGRRIVVKKID